MPFQTQVGVQPAPAVLGDFCDSNPRFTVDVGPGGLVAGPLGLTVGRFAWTTPPIDPDGTNIVANNYGSGPVAGFVHRDQQGLFTTYLQEHSLVIPVGFPVTLFSGGGFWVVNSGAALAQVGMKAYADYGNGLVSFAATATPAAGGSTTGTIAAATFSVTGSIANNIMTVTAVGSGTLYPGGQITVGAATGTAIVSQISGTAGGVGTYYVSIPEQTVASTTLSGTYGLFTAVSALVGSFSVGDVLAGSGGGGVTAGTKITAFGTATGGLGTYIVDLTQTVTSSTITSVGNVETKWIAMSTGLPGELVKISNHALG